MHTVEKAAGRYVEASTDLGFEKKFRSGTFVASPFKFPRYWGASGPLTDNTPFVKVLTDEAAQEDAAKFIRNCYDSI